VFSRRVASPRYCQPKRGSGARKRLASSGEAGGYCAVRSMALVRHCAITLAEYLSEPGAWAVVVRAIAGADTPATR
jgi:hypothetical protein